MEIPNGTLTPMEEAAIEAYKRLDENNEELTFNNIFKAGAEWMANQLKQKLL